MVNITSQRKHEIAFTNADIAAIWFLAVSLPPADNSDVILDESRHPADRADGARGQHDRTGRMGPGRQAIPTKIDEPINRESRLVLRAAVIATTAAKMQGV